MKRKHMQNIFHKIESSDKVIKKIEAEIESLEPVMDDYDAGVVEGLRRAREIVIKHKRSS